jgi:hypothetical protein
MPTANEIIKVILSLPHNKMPGESQITAEALKALSPEALATIAYWEDETDATHVHEAILISYPKRETCHSSKTRDLSVSMTSSKKLLANSLPRN